MNRSRLVIGDVFWSEVLKAFGGTGEQDGWDGEAKRPGGLEIDDQLDFRGLLYRQIARLFAL